MVYLGRKADDVLILKDLVQGNRTWRWGDLWYLGVGVHIYHSTIPYLTSL